MEKFKGYLQLVLIVGFVGFSIVLSRFIGRPQETIDSNRGDEATFFVEVETFDKRPYQIRFNTTGVVQAQSTVQVVPQVSGRVTYVHPNFYTAGRFEAGETLFEIESIDYELEVKRLESDVARAKTALRMEEVEGMASLAEWYQENGDEPAPDLVAREPQLEEAKANLQAAEANLAAAEIRLERTRFTLPEKGRVLRSAIEVGQFLQAGASYGEIYYNGSLEVSASIDDSEQFWLSQSSSPEVEISKSHLGKRTTLPGKLDRGAASLDAATRLGTVYFAFDAVPDDLVPGVFVEVAVNGPLM
ncbi:MAG: efflux RND transporter periplasmic adaptor subunit, partial [Verrucomicrobiota bacterium]